MSIVQSNRFDRLVMSLFLGLLLVGGAVFSLAGPMVRPALAASCTVTPGTMPYQTIQDTINDSTCDPIVVPAGSFTENLVITRHLTLRGAGKIATIVNGAGSGRPVTIDSSGGPIDVRLEDLRVTNGNATSAAHPRFGGGILVTDQATLHGKNLQIDNNVALTGSSSGTGFGGGLAVDNGSAYLTSTTIYSNVASKPDIGLNRSGQGGGLYVNNGVLHLVSSQVQTNVAAYRAGGFAAGGGLYVNQNAQVYLNGNTWQGNIARGGNSDACDFTCIGANSSEGGGAVGVYPSDQTAVISITNDTFIGNIANDVTTVLDNGARGGGIALNASTGQVTATLTGVTMKQNIAVRTSGGNQPQEEGRGGAVWARHTTLTVQRANIYDNQATASGDGSGGGIYIRESSGDSKLINSILASNTALGSGDGAELYINLTGSVGLNDTAKIVHLTVADNGSAPNPKEGIWYDGDSGNRLLITNTIVTSHTTGIKNNNGNPSEVSIDYVLYYANGTDSNAGVPDPANKVTQDPRFVNPAGNDYHISAGSPAIDAGTNAGVVDDIDGGSRDANPDIGADEQGVQAPGTATYLPLILKNFP